MKNSIIKAEINEKKISEISKLLEKWASKEIYPVVGYCAKLGVPRLAFLKALDKFPELENAIIKGELKCYEEALRKYNLFKNAFMFNRSVRVEVGGETHTVEMAGDIHKMGWARTEFEEFKKRFQIYSLTWRRERVSRRTELANAIKESSVDDFLTIKQKMISEIDKKTGVKRKSDKDLTWDVKHLEVVDEEVDINAEES